MRKSLLLSFFIFVSSISFGQGITLLYNSHGGWNNPNSWIQINTPSGQAPIQRIPTEFDDVVFSGTQSGLTLVALDFPGYDSLVVGKNTTVGTRCRSMRISNITLRITNAGHGLGSAMAIIIYTSNGGKVLIDSSSSVPYGDIQLNGGNPAIKDLEIINSSFGTVQPHNTSWCNIFISPTGKARFINSLVTSPFFGSTSTGGEVFAEDCDFSIATFQMGNNSNLTLLNKEVHSSMQFPDLNFNIGRNSTFNSSNANVTSWMGLHFYTSGTVLNGNVTVQGESSGANFLQQDSAHPLPNIINGNVIFQGGVGALELHGSLKFSGNLLNYAGPELIYPDTSTVFVNGQQVFKIGGIRNYRNNVSINNCGQYLCHFKFEVYGSGNSTIKWPIGIPLDTMIINKTGCGKVLVDNSLYVSGQLHVQSGQLVLNPNNGIPYKMVSAGNVVVNNGAGILLRRNAAGVAANIAIGGTLVNNNTSSDSTCAGISNPYNGTILSYNPNVNNITVPVCINSGTTITSNVSGNTYRWERNNGNGYTHISNGPNFSGATTQSLQLLNIPSTWNSDSIRCIVNGATASHTFILNLVSTLAASVTISSVPTSICQGAPTYFYANPVNGGQNPTYQWQINGINQAGNFNQFSSANLVINDQVKVIMQSSMSCATPQSSVSNVLVVNTLGVTPTVAITSSATSVCAGASVTFNANPTNGGAAPTYQWIVNGLLSATTPTLIIPAVTATTVVRVIMYSSLPCAFPVDAVSNQISVTVSPGNATPSVSIAASAITICSTENVIFTATPVNGGAQPTYQWQVNGINAGTNTPVFSTSTLTNGSVVKVIMTSSSLCVTPNTATSNSITVTVSNAIASAVSISASATTVCSNSNVLFTATPVNGGAQPAYQWQVNGVNAGTNSPAFSTSTLANGSVVKVVMTSSSTCANPTMATSNSLTVTVSNQIVPSVSITASAQTVCNNSAVTFTATPVNGGLGPVYQWKKNGIDVGTNSTSFTTTSLMNADVITIVMISNASCASSAAVSSNAITMTVANAVTPAITISGILLVDQGGSTAISSVISNGGTSPIYQWQDSTALHSWQNIGNQSSSVLNYTPASSGDRLRAFLTSSATCANPTTVTSNELGFTVGRPSIPTERVATYPNPASSYLVVDSLSSIDEWNTLTVMSSGGRIYFSRSIVGQNKITVPISSLLPGLYMIRLSRNVGYPVYKKFIKL